MVNRVLKAYQNFSPALHKIIGNVFWLSAERILQMGLGIIVGLWVARYLGPDGFGIFNYAFAFSALISVCSKLGLDSIVIQKLVSDPLRREEVLGTAFILKIASGILTSLVAIGSITLVNPGETLTHWLVGIFASITVFQAFEVIDFWFQSQTQSKYIVFSRSASYVFVCVVRIVMIQMHLPLIAFAWAQLLEAILFALGQIIVYRLKGNFLGKWRFNFTISRDLLAKSWPLIISGFVIVIYMKIDQVMLGQMADAKEVGLYSAAVKISELWYFVPVAIVNSLFPTIIEAKELDEAVYKSRLQKMFNLMSLIALSVALPVAFFSNFIIRLLYGDYYSGAGLILSIHIWAGLFVSLGTLANSWIIVEGLTRVSALSTTIGAITNVILNLFLIRDLGGVGAAIATLISYFLAAYLSYAFFPSTRDVFMMQTRALGIRRWNLVQNFDNSRKH